MSIFKYLSYPPIRIGVYIMSIILCFTIDPMHNILVNHNDPTVFAFASARSLKTLELPRSGTSDCIVEDVARRLSNVTFLDVSSCTKIGARALEAFGKNCKSLVGLLCHRERRRGRHLGLSGYKNFGAYIKQNHAW